MQWCAERDSNPRPTVCKTDERVGRMGCGEGRRCYDGLRLAWLERICGEVGVACFSEFCGPLPDLGAAANDPCVASPAASRRVRPSGSLAAGYLAPLGSDLPENVAEHRRLEQGTDLVLVGEMASLMKRGS